MVKDFVINTPDNYILCTESFSFFYCISLFFYTHCGADAARCQPVTHRTGTNALLHGAITTFVCAKMSSWVIPSTPMLISAHFCFSDEKPFRSESSKNPKKEKENYKYSTFTVPSGAVEGGCLHIEVALSETTLDIYQQRWDWVHEKLKFQPVLFPPPEILVKLYDITFLENMFDKPGSNSPVIFDETGGVVNIFFLTLIN